MKFSFVDQVISSRTSADRNECDGSMRIFCFEFLAELASYRNQIFVPDFDAVRHLFVVSWKAGARRRHLVR